MHPTPLRSLMIIALAFALAACSAPAAPLPATATSQPVLTPTAVPALTLVDPTQTPTAAPTATAAAPQPSPAADTPAPTASAAFPALFDMRWFDLNHGWAVASQDGEKIVRTEDGGQTWRSVMPDPSMFVGSPDDDLFFLDSNTAWLLMTAGDSSSRTLYRTLDGGKTWQSWPVPFEPLQVAALKFFDAKNGWAMVSNICPAVCPAMLYRTGDGGKTWTLAKDVTSPDQKKLDPGVIHAFSVYFQNQFTLWAGIDIDTLYVSRNSAKTWQKVRWAPEGASTAGQPFFLDTRQGFLAFVIGDQVFVNTTIDGGKTWTPAPKSFTQEDGFGYEQFVTAKDWFFTYKAHLIATHDGGTTWEVLDAPAATFNVTQFIDGANGWATAYAGDGGVFGFYRTADGGLTWQKLDPRLVE